MQIHRIVLENFMSHNNTEIVFPDRGVVVFMGPNGAGKSTLVEAVSVAYWGRTLRGTPAWRKGEAGQVRVENHDITAIWHVTKGGVKRLEWRVVTDEGIGYRDYDTTTKAEGELRKMVVDHEIWRRTHVFSSSDAVNFSSSTDGARKRFIEQILGLDRFDSASEKCKAELIERRSAFGSARSTLVHTQEMRSAALETLSALVDPIFNLFAAPAHIPEPEGGHDRMSDLEGQHKTVACQLQVLGEQPVNEIDPCVRQWLVRAEVACLGAAKWLRLVEAGNCGMCGQIVEDIQPGRAMEVFTNANAEQQSAHEAVGREQDRVAHDNLLQRKRSGELQVESQQLHDEHNAMAHAFERANMRAAEIARHSQIREAALLEHEKALTLIRTRRMELDAKIFDYDDQIDEAVADIETLKVQVAELEVCHHVLGLKGVRVPVLGHALEAAEFFANSGLAGLGAGLQIRLRPYRVLGDGRTNADIGFEIEGAGGGYGYDATSGGERRRIDACLLLAFAEVSAAGSGCPDGTLWIDELFDAIDADGCVAAAQMLADIGKRRCVVVITHREDLARKIPAVARYRVDDGVITQV